MTVNVKKQNKIIKTEKMSQEAFYIDIPIECSDQWCELELFGHNWSGNWSKLSKRLFVTKFVRRSDDHDYGGWFRIRNGRMVFLFILSIIIIIASIVYIYKKCCKDPLIRAPGNSMAAAAASTIAAPNHLHNRQRERLDRDPLSSGSSGPNFAPPKYPEEIGLTNVNVNTRQHTPPPPDVAIPAPYNITSRGGGERFEEVVDRLAPPPPDIAAPPSYNEAVNMPHVTLVHSGGEGEGGEEGRG